MLPGISPRPRSATLIVSTRSRSAAVGFARRSGTGILARNEQAASMYSDAQHVETAEQFAPDLDLHCVIAVDDAEGDFDLDGADQRQRSAMAGRRGCCLIDTSHSRRIAMTAYGCSSWAACPALSTERNTAFLPMASAN